MKLIRPGTSLLPMVLAVLVAAFAAGCAHDNRATGSNSSSAMGTGSGSVSDATGASGPGISSGAPRGMTAGSDLSGSNTPTQKRNLKPKPADAYDDIGTLGVTGKNTGDRGPNRGKPTKGDMNSGGSRLDNMSVGNGNTTDLGTGTSPDIGSGQDSNNNTNNGNTTGTTSGSTTNY